jgi:hypothetical protein
MARKTMQPGVAISSKNLAVLVANGLYEANFVPLSGELIDQACLRFKFQPDLLKAEFLSSREEQSYFSTQPQHADSNSVRL